MADKPARPQKESREPGDEKSSDAREAPQPEKPGEPAPLSREELERLRRELLRKFH